MKQQIKYSFKRNAFVDIIDKDDKNNEKMYHVQFIDNDTNEVIFEETKPSNHWVKTGREYYTNWKIKITHEDKVIFDAVKQKIKR